jgi:hypothetical protein
MSKLVEHTMRHVVRIRRRGFHRDIRRGDRVRWADLSALPPRLRDQFANPLVLAIYAHARREGIVQRRTRTHLVVELCAEAR